MAQSRNYDLIVVGAGTAGIIAAARIAEKGVNPKTGEKLRIALVEAGPHLLKGKKKPGFGNAQDRQMIPQVVWEELDSGALLDHWPCHNRRTRTGSALNHQRRRTCHGDLTTQARHPLGTSTAETITPVASRTSMRCGFTCTNLNVITTPRGSAMISPI